jgi:hypothetical protein
LAIHYEVLRILHARCGALHVVRCRLLLQDVVPGMINLLFTRWGGEVRSARSWRVASDIRPIRTAQIRRLIICLELQDGGTGNGFRYLQTLRFSSISLFLLLALLGRLGLGCRQLELWGIRRYGSMLDYVGLTLSGVVFCPGPTCSQAAEPPRKFLNAWVISSGSTTILFFSSS